MTPEDEERLRAEEMLELLANIEKAVQQVWLYVADALLRPDAGGDSGGGG